MYSVVSVVAALAAIIIQTSGDVLIYENAGPINANEGQGNIGYYRMGDCMRFQFVVNFHSWCTEDTWCSVFHGGDDRTFSNQVNQRMPGVWLYTNAEALDTFHIVLTHVSSGNPAINVGPSGDLALNTDYAFDISFTQSSLTVIINGEVVYDNQNYPNHCVAGQTCHGVRVGEASGAYQDLTPFQIGQGLYGNDYVGLPGTVSDIKIYSCGDACDTAGLALSTAHACQCLDTCEDDTGRFCNTMDFVLEKLPPVGAREGGYCPSGVCCCSCPNCGGHIPLE